MDSLPYSFGDDHQYMKRGFHFNQKYPFLYDNLGIKTDPVQPLIDLSACSYYELYFRFLELLPTDLLRRFMYTSKDNYKNGVVKRGILVRRLLFYGNRRNKCNKLGELVITLKHNQSEKPIYKYFDVQIVSSLFGIFHDQSYNYFRRTYQSLEIKHYNDYSGFQKLFHPGIKHLYFNSVSGFIFQGVTVILDAIKKSNVSDIYIKKDIILLLEERKMNEMIEGILESKYKGDLLLLLHKKFRSNCYALALRWHRGIMYHKIDYNPNSKSRGFTPNMAQLNHFHFPH